MKKIIATILIVVISGYLLYPIESSAAVARVQAFSGSNITFSSSVTTSSVTVTAGNLIICTAEADVATDITMTDSKSNTWTEFQANTLASTFRLETWYAKATVGGSGYTVTATDNGGGVDSIIICEEWSGQDLTAPADQKAGATGTGSSALNSGASGTTAQANEIVIGTGVASGASSLSLGAGYSNLTTVSTAFSTLGFESKIVSATGAQTATMTAGGSISWVMHVTTFKEASSAVVPLFQFGDF